MKKVYDRKQYARAWGLLYLSLLVCCFILSSAMESSDPTDSILFMIIVVTVMIYCKIVFQLRRIRDLELNELSYTILSFIPVVNIYIAWFLLLKRGKTGEFTKEKTNPSILGTRNAETTESVLYPLEKPAIHQISSSNSMILKEIQNYHEKTPLYLSTLGEMVNLGLISKEDYKKSKEHILNRMEVQSKEELNSLGNDKTPKENEVPIPLNSSKANAYVITCVVILVILAGVMAFFDSRPDVFANIFGSTVNASGVNANPNQTTAVPTQIHNSTIKPSPTSISEFHPQVTVTQGYNPTVGFRMENLISTLYSSGVIHSREGDYYSLPDFDESWAQIGWYEWWTIGHKANNFVLRADASWESASNKANWDNAGCGFVFSIADNDNHHAIFLDMDGYVRTHKVMNGYFYDQQGGYYGKFEIPSDHAELVLAVEKQVLTVLVNGKVVVKYEDKYIKQGDIALSLASGTNKDFGTRCEMENIDFWEIESY